MSICFCYWWWCFVCFCFVVVVLLFCLLFVAFCLFFPRRPEDSIDTDRSRSILWPEMLRSCEAKPVSHSGNTEVDSGCRRTVMPTNTSCRQSDGSGCTGVMDGYLFTSFTSATTHCWQNSFRWNTFHRIVCSSSRHSPHPHPHPALPPPPYRMAACGPAKTSVTFS